MRKMRKIGIILVITLIVSLSSVWIGNYFITRYNINEKAEKKDTNGVVIDLEKILPNAEVPLKVGQRFEYKNTGYDKNGTVISYEDSVVTVEGTEKIDDNDYYVVYDRWNVTVIKPSDYTLNVVEKYYYNSRNGNVAKIEMMGQEKEIIEDAKNIEWVMTKTGVAFASWMLYLDDNFLFKCKYGECEIRVVEREQINGRETFKIEFENFDCKGYSLIDVEKRLLIKRKNICGSTTYERNLISEKFNNENND